MWFISDHYENAYCRVEQELLTREDMQTKNEQWKAAMDDDTEDTIHDPQGLSP